MHSIEKQHTRTCRELGVCQARKPACTGCQSRFAPGVIEGPYQRNKSLVKRSLRVAAQAIYVYAPFVLFVGVVVGMAYGILALNK
jgi:hypothetical protein